MTASHCRLLIIQANPPGPGMDHLTVAEEQRNLADALWGSLNRDLFQSEVLSAARIADLPRWLRRVKPHIVHFSGHGDGRGGLVLNAPGDKRGQRLSAKNLAETLRAYQAEAGEPVRLVVLAGCNTAHGADLLCQHVDCVVGMSDRVRDAAVTEVFTPQFYAALGDGRSVQNAADSAAAMLRGQGHSADARAVMVYCRDDVDPARMVLAELAQPLLATHSRLRSYWGSLLESNLAKVSLSLFDPHDPRLGRKVPLLDIFTPLPVDFSITLEVDSKGQARNWWCEARGEEPGGDSEREWFEPGWHPLPEEKLAEHKVRQRVWAELNAAEDALQPLVDIACAWSQVQERSRRREKTTVRWQADASHAALVQPRFVLIGDPGSGKSTFLRHLALCWAGHLLRETGDAQVPAAAELPSLPGWTMAFTPIYVELRTLVDIFPTLPDNPDHAADLPGLSELRRHLRQHPLVGGDENLIDDLFGLLRQGRAAILLDGLDEVSQAADPRRQVQIQAFVGELAEEFQEAPIIVTARPYAYDQADWALQGFGHTRLMPLDDDRQAELARRLFMRLLRHDRTRDASHEAEAFIDALQHIPDDLCSNPLLLTLLAALWVRREAGETDLPSTRGELYRRALKLLLQDWVEAKYEGKSFEKDLGLNLEDLSLVLELVAFDAQARRSSPDEPAVIEEKDIYGALRLIGHGRIADDLLDHLEQQAGMLLEAVDEGPGVLVSTYEKRFRFLHLSFQEYLAACELLHRPGDIRPYGLPVLEKRAFPQGLADKMIEAPVLWANVLRLAVDELLYRGRLGDAWELLQRCCRPYCDEDDTPQAALLALQVALEADREAELFQAWSEHQVHELCQVAIKALTDHQRFTSKERNVAGELLGQRPGLDTRPGVGLRPDGLPDIDWVLVPEADPASGQIGFIYQDGERRREATFWMARFPITYLQFQAFVVAKDGFRNPRWWQGLAAGDSHRAQPGNQRFEYWNHPRERVSWYDAVAFCRWLSEQARQHPDLLPEALRGQRDWKITLPTEWQWEKAARGYDGQRYPWGPEYLQGYANIDETYTRVGPHYLQKTSAAGMYPQGASPYGIQDLSGNVWEWCLNEYGNPERIQEGGDEWRVLRGGSWLNHHENAAAPARYDLPPNSRDYYIGFGVVVWGPSL